MGEKLSGHEVDPASAIWKAIKKRVQTKAEREIPPYLVGSATSLEVVLEREKQFVETVSSACWKAIQEDPSAFEYWALLDIDGTLLRLTGDRQAVVRPSAALLCAQLTQMDPRLHLGILTSRDELYLQSENLGKRQLRAILQSCDEDKLLSSADVYQDQIEAIDLQAYMAEKRPGHTPYAGTLRKLYVCAQLRQQHPEATIILVDDDLRNQGVTATPGFVPVMLDETNTFSLA